MKGRTEIIIILILQLITHTLQDPRQLQKSESGGGSEENLTDGGDEQEHVFDDKAFK